VPMRVIAKKRCRAMVEPPEKGERATLNPNLSTRLKPTFFDQALGRRVGYCRSKRASGTVSPFFEVARRHRTRNGPSAGGGSGAVLLGECRGRPGTLDDVDLPYADTIKFCFMKPNAPRRADLTGPRQNGLSAASD
jgi:hypothetical protein